MKIISWGLAGSAGGCIAKAWLASEAEAQQADRQIEDLISGGRVETWSAFQS